MSEKPEVTEQVETPPIQPIQVRNFMQDVLNAIPEGETKDRATAILLHLEAVVDYAMSIGYDQDTARRCVDLWIIDVAWQHLLKGTNLMRDTFVLIKGPGGERMRLDGNAPQIEDTAKGE